MRNFPGGNLGDLGLDASGSFTRGASIANQIIDNRLRRDQQNQNYNIQDRQVALQEQAAQYERQQQQVIQQLSKEAFERPDVVLPQLYAQNPAAAAKVSEGIQQRYSQQYNTLALLTKDTKAENKQATYELLKPELQRMFPELEFGDKASTELMNVMKANASVIKAKMKTNLEFRDTAQGIVGFNPLTGESTSTGIASKPNEATGGGATGSLVRQVMQDNPGMTFTQALQLVQTGFRQNTRMDKDGNVEVIPGAVSAKQDIKGGEKLAEKLGESQAKDLEDLRAKADDAQDSLHMNKQTIELLDKGVITGAGAEYKINFGKALQAMGINLGEDAVSNSEAFVAQRAGQVATKIKAFGSGTGLSDADRDYAQQMAAGKINLNESSIRKIISMDNKLNDYQIKKYDTRRNRLSENLKSYAPDIKSENQNQSDKKDFGGFKLIRVRDK